jgi:glycosyltransferase involved in cell wall biosynthesis
MTTADLPTKAPVRSAPMLRALFVMEQHIGHRSYYENLRRFIDPMEDVEATWVEVTYDQRASSWSRWPLLASSLRGTLAGRAQVVQGLRRSSSDAVLFNTQVPAAISGRLARRSPYVLCTDITPVQYDAMAEQYDHRPDGKGLIARYKRWTNANLFKGAARILAWSTWVRSSLVDDYGVAPGKVEVLPPGVDIEVWQPVPQKSRHSENTARILFVGGDFRRKGGDLLLEAFRRLPANTAELVVVTRSEVRGGSGRSRTQRYETEFARTNCALPVLRCVCAADPR